MNNLLAAIFTVLTLGIYALYYPIKLLKWQYSHTKALYRTEKIRALSREHEIAANKDFAKYSLAANDTELKILKSGIDGTESEERLEELANSGNPYAQYQLALKLKGENDLFDGRALELLEASANAKYYKALLSYAVQNKDNEDRYSRLLADAARAGSSEATWHLAEHYEAAAYAQDGGKSAQSLALFKQAAYWFKVAIEQEYPMAMASRLDYAVLIDRIALLEAGQNRRANCTKKNKAKPVVTTVVTGAVVILAVCMIIFTVCAVSIVDHNDRSFFGYKAFIVLSDSMSRTDFKAGDLILCKKVDPSTLQIGDIISYQSTNKENYGAIVTHKIREITTDAEGNPGFITYGTTTDTDDENIVTYSFVLGKYEKKLSGVGKFVMFVRSRFAWFADSVTSGKNKIVAGNLDVKLEYSLDGTTWTTVNEETNMFKDNALWEPGYIEVVYLQVKNAGSLALKYQFGINVADKVLGETADGDPIDLANFIEFGVVEASAAFADIAAAHNAVKDTAGLISAGYSSAVGHLTAGNTSNMLALVVYMPAEVGNAAKHGTDKQAPKIYMGINLVATQDTVESDSFNNQYDKDAMNPQT